MTLLSEYYTPLRYRINDVNGTRYSDTALDVYLEQAVYALQTTKFYIKFIVSNLEIVRKSDGTTDPTNEEDQLILLQTQILMKYAELEQYSREGLVVKDIRGTIDTSNVSKQLSKTLDRLEEQLKDMICTVNKSKNRNSYGPKTMCPQTYVPGSSDKTYTFKTKYNT